MINGDCNFSKNNKLFPYMYVSIHIYQYFITLFLCIYPYELVKGEVYLIMPYFIEPMMSSTLRTFLSWTIKKYIATC